MLPEHRQDRSALRWIRSELDQNLREARAALEEFSEGRGERLATCGDLLHQVHGALDLSQIYGGAMLADELEQLMRALSAGTVKRSDAAAEALMLGLVQLPAYLEQVERGGADIPLALLPLMNDLRAARDAPLVSETSLFAPKLDAVIAAETVRPGSGNRDLPRILHHYRSHYHRGLLNWIRDQHADVALKHIRDVLDVLNSAAGTARFRRLLDAAEALAIALGEDGDGASLAVKPLFGKLDRVFKRVIDQGEEAAMLDFPVDLLKNLLYYIARSSSRDPAVLAVKQAADLVNTFPEGTADGQAIASLGAPDRDLFGAVGEALALDLRDVKDELDLYMRGDHARLDRLTALAAPIRRIGDTLGMVGRGDLRARLKRRCDDLTAIEQAGAPPDGDFLMALAGELLSVESSLAGLGSDDSREVDLDTPMEGSESQTLSLGEMRQHLRAAVDEALVELAKAKDEILAYLDAPQQPQRLEPVTARLYAVGGAMRLLELPEAGAVLNRLRPMIADLAAGRREVPDQARRDALADVIMSAELYLQTLVEPGGDRERLLAFAEQGLATLGLDGEARVETVESAHAVPEHMDAVTAVTEELPEGPVAEDALAPSPEPAGALPVEPAFEATLTDQASKSALPSVASAVAPAAGVGGYPAVSGGAATMSPDVEIDPDILEVFIEEADEELAAIQANLPGWRSNTDEREALLTARRSFHTLKGSGRIVGATNIGEFAWALENLLNRVIDGTTPVSDEVFGLLDDVMAVLPALVDEVRRPQDPGTDVAALSARAFELAGGGAAPTPAAQVAVVPSVEQPAEPAAAQPVEAEAEAEAAAPQHGGDTLPPEQALAESRSDVMPDEVEQQEIADAAVVPAASPQAPELPPAAPGSTDVAGYQPAESGWGEPVESLELAAETTVPAPGDLTRDEDVVDLPGEVVEPFGLDEHDQAPAPFEVVEIDVSADLPGDETELIELADDETRALAFDVIELPGVDEDVDGAQGADGAPLETPVDEVSDESILNTAELASDSELSELDGAPLAGIDSSLSAVFLGEAHDHMAVLDRFIAQCTAQLEECRMEEAARRAIHTLRGSARTAGADAVADLAEALEHYAERLLGRAVALGDTARQLFIDAHRRLGELLVAVEDPGHAVGDWQTLRAQIEQAAADVAATAPPDEPAASPETAPLPVDRHDLLDPDLVEVFLDEARELLESLEGELGDWQSATPGDRMPVVQLQRTLHTMKGGARLSGALSVGDLSHALESVFEAVAERRIADDQRLKQLVRHATDLLAQDIEQLGGGALPDAHPVMIDRLEAAARGEVWSEVAAGEMVLEAEPAGPVERPAGRDDSALPEVAGPPAAAVIEDGSSLPGIGPEAEVLPEVDAPSTAPSADADAVASAGLPAVEPPPAKMGDFDQDSELLTDSQLMTDSELLGDSSYLTLSTPGADTGAVGAVVRRDSTVVQFPGSELAPEGEGFVPRRPLPDEPPAQTAGTERVRVASEALDQMVNNAGEVSIYRARIEQQNSSFAFNLGELGQTIDRLRAQLRSLEIETEAQILSRHEREGETRADFDPLEMDRYSTIQQLSRALSETVEDLSNLGLSLNDLSRDTDTLLLQQARVTTDLQDSLLRTRMVKFASRVPRLERVVRQTAHGLGKQAGLKVIGGEEDMDRAILERMMGPLEHLLRNAVSHGIEDPQTRLAADKPTEGVIMLALAREGTDVMLTLSDDGAGLDRERIRAKAIERGLLDAEATPTDDDLDQMILQPGFSTAQELSQVSGRGVGMDVVLTEVKQLGGTLDISSQPGHGSRFVIRLPFTLAITDALLIMLGDDYYAVPHSSMDGVARIPVDDLRRIYAGEQAGFEYDGRDYRVRYLGDMLGSLAAHIAEGARWLPLLLVRTGEHRVAIQVDGLLGNRQIVVKSIGAQLTGVRWFTGGTILADGQIALILDTSSLVRLDSAQQNVTRLEAPLPAARGVSVMVVDDSITVRKVTSRLLERHNMQVVTAKDGVDAVTLLQEHRPDVMLLDIEMPRMDGYELARHMRSTPELADIPIIMITSRTGDKHRTRAIELGVKRYLGKPYQESDLLENIYTVLAETAL